MANVEGVLSALINLKSTGNFRLVYHEESVWDWKNKQDILERHDVVQRTKMIGLVRFYIHIYI